MRRKAEFVCDPEEPKNIIVVLVIGDDVVHAQIFNRYDSLAVGEYVQSHFPQK